jgi:excisionase family DNA binding protein
MNINDLSTHPRPYVSIRELADYWGLTRYELYKQIDAGTLSAVRLGPRLYRIRTSDAVRFADAARIDEPRSMPHPPIAGPSLAEVQLG